MFLFRNRAFSIWAFPLQNVKASDEEVYYSESQIESIAQNYTENESLFEKCLCSDEGIAYWKMMHKINADHAFTWALDISSKMIEEYPDKKRYAEILSCLISMQTGNVVEQVSEQSRFDHLKDTEDITWNAMEIANELVGKTGVIGSINDIVGKIFDGTSTQTRFASFFREKTRTPNFLRFRKDIFSLALWVYHEPGGFLRFLPVFVKECSEV